MSWPAMTGDRLVGAFEWNVARTWRVIGRPAPSVPSPLQARVLTALQGAWAAGGDDGCRPLKGKHLDGCSHRLNLVPVRVGALADTILGLSGGSQTRQLRRVIDDLTTLPIRYRPYRPGEFAQFLGPLVSLVEVTEDLRDHLIDAGITHEPDLVVRFADDLFDGLMQGLYQRIPVELLQGLPNEDFLVWLAVLCRAAGGRPTRKGTWMSIYFTGRKPTVAPWGVGMGSLGGKRLENAITRAADRGNALQSEFMMVPVPKMPTRGRARMLLAVQLVRNELAAAWTAAELDNLGSSVGPERQPEPESASSKDMKEHVRLDRSTSSKTYDPGSGALGQGAGISVSGYRVPSVGSGSIRRRDAVTWTRRGLRSSQSTTRR